MHTEIELKKVNLKIEIGFENQTDPIQVVINSDRINTNTSIYHLPKQLKKVSKTPDSKNDFSSIESILA